MGIKITKTAEKEIKRLGRIQRTRVLEKIRALPSGDVKKLSGYKDYYRLRVGDLRIIYQYNGDMIIIAGVLPRGEAYKRY